MLDKFVDLIMPASLSWGLHARVDSIKAHGDQGQCLLVKHSVTLLKSVSSCTYESVACLGIRVYNEFNND
jgi:hypothetical protein